MSRYNSLQGCMFPASNYNLQDLDSPGRDQWGSTPLPLPLLFLWYTKNEWDKFFYTRLSIWFWILGSLSSDVFERRTSTGSDPFSLLISLDATIFVLPSVLILTETICPKICSKSRLKSAKSPFPVDVRRSKTSLLKLPIVNIQSQNPSLNSLLRTLPKVYRDCSWWVILTFLFQLVFKKLKRKK